MKPTQRILWAVDAYSRKKNIDKKAAEALNLLQRRQELVVEPVCVLTMEQLRKAASSFPENDRDCLSNADGRLRAKLSGTRVKGLKPPTILLPEKRSQGGEIRALLDHAHTSRASLIVVASEGKTGARRLLLGSFAERLLAETRIPLLVVRPEIRLPKEFRRILFPTDLSRRSLNAFKVFLPFARSVNAKVTLYFRVDPFPVAFEPFDVPLLSDGYTHPATLRAKKAALDWVRLAARNGVSAELVIDAKPAPLPDAILLTAKACGADIIAMPQLRGPVASAILGSIGRQILRSAPCPVWILHT